MNAGTVVVDASLAVKWVLEEPYTREAEELLAKWKDNEVRTIAPGLPRMTASSSTCSGCAG